MSDRSLRLVVAAMVVGALLIGGAGIARVALGGTGPEGAMVIAGGVLAVALIARPVGFLLDRRRRRRARRAAATAGRAEAQRC